jgi:putative membrane protein
MKNYLKHTARTTLVAILSLGLGVAITARAAEEKMEPKTATKLSANDKKFVKKAYKGGLKEIAEAKMAQDKAKGDPTKEVAEHMITDHSKANDKLLEIAKEENLDLSKVEAKPSSMAGSDFDKTYLTELKADHEKDIAMFEKEANDSGAKEDSDVVKFAKDTLPTLKEHLKMVEDALAKVQ